MLAVLSRQEYLVAENLGERSSWNEVLMDNVGVMMRSIGTAAGATRTEAKLQALSWLASQLEWERTLGALRHEEVDAEERAA